MNTIEKAIMAAGGVRAIAAALGMSGWGVRKWVHDGIPAKHIIWLSRQGRWQVKPHEIAPDIYPYPGDGMPRGKRPVEPRVAA
jgi:DNA-binding transcriptional regulator YdaS (Cro superfamily)